MNRRLVTASRRVSRFSKAVSRVRRISAGEKRLKMSSVDSGSSQNCGVSRSVSGVRTRSGPAYRCPVWIISGDDPVLGEPKDALLEHQLRVRGSHFELRLAFVVEFMG
jgi:hypothetical protein